MNEKGIGLIETIVALGVAVVVMTGIVTLTVNTLRSATQSRLMLTATKAANEELERIRAFRDISDWQDFITAMTPCNSPLDGAKECHMTSALGVAVDSRDPVGTNGENMQRFFTVTDLTDGSIDALDNVLKFSVTVTWISGTNERSVHTYTDLSNWRTQ